MIALRKYAWVGYTAARSNVAYLGELAARILFLGIILYVFLQLWQVTYNETGAKQLGGLSLAQMLWYLAMTEALTLSNPLIAEEVDQDVRTGGLAVQLIRPLSYPLYRLWTALGERGVRFTMNTLVGTLIALVFVGPIPFSLDGLLMFALSLPFAFVLQFQGMFLIGLGAFWLEDTSGLRLIYSRLTMILGGMLIPLELFPDTWQPILRALPFSSMVYGPARLFVQPDGAFLRDLLVRQGIAIGIFALLNALIYRAGVKRINANGG
jgi:ABC-2 type transport system permease protein